MKCFQKYFVNTILVRSVIYTGCLADLDNVESVPCLRKFRENWKNRGMIPEKNDKSGKVREIYFTDGKFPQFFFNFYRQIQNF